MENGNLPIQIIEDVKLLVNQLSSVSYGNNVIPYLNLNSFGSGQTGYDALKDAFNGLDLSKALETVNLDNKIKRQEKELKDLEKKYTNLTAIIGESSGDNEGALAHSILKLLNEEIINLTNKRDELVNENKLKEEQFDAKSVVQKDLEKSWEAAFDKKKSDEESKHEKKMSDLNDKLEIETKTLNGLIQAAKVQNEEKIRNAEKEADRKVTLIKQFSDFLAETNSDMRIYFWVIFCLVAGAGLAIKDSVPDLLKSFESYDVFIKSLGKTATPWQIINGAFGLFIVKLPWALCLSAIFTGIYSLIKGVIITYEKINQDKRNMSAIYAISGNVAQSLNEYGMAVAEEEVEDEETKEKFTAIRVEKKGLEQKRESLRWNQIMNYFERMQQNKQEVTLPDDDPSKLKLVSDVLNKLIDRLPKTA